MFFPFVIIRSIEGANGRNWPGVVMIDPAAAYPAAVLAQEACEAMHKTNPANLLRVRFSDDARRDMELMGHECEVQAAALIYGRDRAVYRAAEAVRMQRGYDGLFRRMTPDDIAARMAIHAPQSARWVGQHIEELRRYTTI